MSRDRLLRHIEQRSRRSPAWAPGAEPQSCPFQWPIGRPGPHDGRSAQRRSVARRFVRSPTEVATNAALSERNRPPGAPPDQYVGGEGTAPIRTVGARGGRPPLPRTIFGARRAGRSRSPEDIRDDSPRPTLPRKGRTAGAGARRAASPPRRSGRMNRAPARCSLVSGGAVHAPAVAAPSVRENVTAAAVRDGMGDSASASKFGSTSATRGEPRFRIGRHGFVVYRCCCAGMQKSAGRQDLGKPRRFPAAWKSAAVPSNE